MWQDLKAEDMHVKVKSSQRGLSLTTTSKENKPWAVEYSNGEKHRYTTYQIHRKFGLTDVELGASVEHKRRGHGIVTASETAAENQRCNKRDSLLLGAEFDESFSTAVPAVPKLDVWQMNDSPTTGHEIKQPVSPELSLPRRPMRQGLDGKLAETLWAELQMNNSTTNGPTAGHVLPELSSARRPVRRALRPEPDQRRREHEHHVTCLLLACTPGFAVSKMQKME